MEEGDGDAAGGRGSLGRNQVAFMIPRDFAKMVKAIPARTPNLHFSNSLLCPRSSQVTLARQVRSKEDKQAKSLGTAKRLEMLGFVKRMELSLCKNGHKDTNPGLNLLVDAWNVNTS